MNRYNNDRYDEGRMHSRRHPQDLKQEFERRYSGERRQNRDNYYHDSSYELDASNNYRSRDYDMERDYYQHTRGDRHLLDDIRQGYGYGSFSGDSRGERNPGSEMQRERYAQYRQEMERRHSHGGTAHNIHEGRHSNSYGRNRDNTDWGNSRHFEDSRRQRRYGPNADRGGYDDYTRY